MNNFRHFKKPFYKEVAVAVAEALLPLLRTLKSKWSLIYGLAADNFVKRFGKIIGSFLNLRID